MTNARLMSTVALLGVVLPRPAMSQQSTAPSCAEAARIISSGDTTVVWARAKISHCPEEGGAVIAAAWKSISGDPGRLAELRTWSHSLHDQRIADAAVATARDASRPVPVRLVALQALLSYVNPDLTVELNVLESPRPERHLAWASDQVVVVGAQIPGAGIAEQVGKLMLELSQSDPNPTVRGAAHFLAQGLSDLRPELIPLGPGALTLTNVCGTRYRITNGTDLDLSVRLTTDTGGIKRSLRIAAHATPEMTLADAGTAHLQRGAIEVATASSGHAACP